MRSKVVRILALALLLSSVGLTVAQQSGAPPGNHGKQPGPGNSGTRLPKQKTPPEKSKLEEMLTEALKNNPDIRVAAAKLAEADAKLNRTRLQVTQKVVMLYHAIETQKIVVENAEKRDKRAQNAGASIPSGQIDETHQSLALAKAKLAELQAQLPALLGKGQFSTATELLRAAAIEAVQPKIRFWSDGYDIELEVPEGKLEKREGKLVISQPKPNLPQAEKVRKALQTPVRVDYKDMTFDAILKDLAKKAPALSYRNLHRRGNFEDTTKINLRFEEALPVSAVLQALADETGCNFYVREYGILAIDHRSAPPGAMTVEEFLRQKPAKQPGNQLAGGKNPPAENVEGRVKAVDGSGLMTITIGSDAGLTKGHTLELFRLDPQAPSESSYLGTVRVLEAEAHQAVVQPVGRLSAPPQPGDRVASRLPGN